NNTFKRKNLVLCNNELIKIGRSINKLTTPSDSNGFFDSKVLSRSHAEIWFEKSDSDVSEKREYSVVGKIRGRVLIKDLGSSNGTFLNGRKIYVGNDGSETVELNNGDLLVCIENLIDLLFIHSFVCLLVCSFVRFTLLLLILGVWN